MIPETAILLVEDNLKDEARTLRVLRKGKIASSVVVARDGVEALDYLLAIGPDGSRNTLPQLVLLDLKLPKIDGHEVSQADPRRRTNAASPGRHSHHLGRGQGPVGRVSARRQQLCAQARGLRRIRPGGDPVGALLAGLERAATTGRRVRCSPRQVYRVSVCAVSTLDERFRESDQ
jgi:CheY-like chemotaxis protein